VAMWFANQLLVQHGAMACGPQVVPAEVALVRVLALKCQIL
jgi:hypothetical protein